MGVGMQALEQQVQLFGELTSLTERGSLSDAEALCLYNCFARTQDTFNTVGEYVQSEAQRMAAENQ
ncbi:uncharacterized protein AMSG_10699 [Thecamonas trahens ATCC 50062]|uniref:Mitochondrial import inner membrane translocase subunit n=1 Tax=Thecamonas trahens ATCC 50062 TaxID=461836 RepID=A0A0L0DSW4_THETB|nr:hypothetical protein AMSG_10699 [Thecamonas trahens ATCC 50062]KNC55101.1 hypothetical protein AMSG_10699 [Thecamonas trahens ATCC 50062]|eukprot:XP_013753285.1 hypothetical protein AMSG_10699 [Thecamonas trahens ATCC 50062]